MGRQFEAEIPDVEFDPLTVVIPTKDRPRGLLRRTRRPQYALYEALSRFTPALFARMTEWDRLRRLSRRQRREVSSFVAEARSSPFAAVRD